MERREAERTLSLAAAHRQLLQPPAAALVERSPQHGRLADAGLTDDVQGTTAAGEPVERSADLTDLFLAADQRGGGW